MMSALALSVELDGSTPISARNLTDPQLITWTSSVGSETPSPYSMVEFFGLERSTGVVVIQEDPSYVIDKAFRFMDGLASILPYSEAADAAGDALVQRIRSSSVTRRLARKVGE
jgi:hypothetical protein